MARTTSEQASVNGASSPVGQELTRKITPKAFGWDKPAIQLACLSNQNEDIHLYRVFGRASDLKSYRSRQNGEDGQPLEGYGLLGQFVATGGANSPVNAGVQVTGGALYLPGYVQDQIVAAIKASNPDFGVAVDLAVDIYARYDESAATSYVFIARSLIKQDTSALEAIENKMAAMFDGEIPALPGATVARALPSA